MRYFHELSDSTLRRLTRKGITWQEVIDRYKQPDWCNYPEALAGAMGCWSLIGCWSLMDIDLRHKISREYCKKCDCFKEGK